MNLKAVICKYVLYRNFYRHLSAAKDPYGMINHKEIQMILCRMNHVPKEEWNNVIDEAKKFRLIEYMGKNQFGCFYRVN